MTFLAHQLIDPGMAKDIRGYAKNRMMGFIAFDPKQKGGDHRQIQRNIALRKNDIFAMQFFIDLLDDKDYYELDSLSRNVNFMARKCCDLFGENLFSSLFLPLMLTSKLINDRDRDMLRNSFRRLPENSAKFVENRMQMKQFW